LGIFHDEFVEGKAVYAQSFFRSDRTGVAKIQRVAPVLRKNKDWFVLLCGRAPAHSLLSIQRFLS
jgi:hypothetical protein